MAPTPGEVESLLQKGLGFRVPRSSAMHELAHVPGTQQFEAVCYVQPLRCFFLPCFVRFASELKEHGMPCLKM